MNNLMAEISIAVQNEKTHRIAETAKSFGVATSEIHHLKGALTPALPYEFRLLNINADHLDGMVETSKKIRMVASTEILADSEEKLKLSSWTAERNCAYKSAGYMPVYGRYSE